MPQNQSPHTHFPIPHNPGVVNSIGLWTLYAKEVRRFLKVYMQTIIAPVITTLLFYMVFAVAMGGDHRMMGDISYIAFLAPGLIMMGMAQNAFANTSSSLVIAKVQGNIVDLLMPPLSTTELMVGLVAGGISRGLVVGLATWLTFACFMPLMPPYVGIMGYHAVMGTMLMALLGVIGGVWAQKFDHLAAVTNFIITPLTFLSGTFYSTRQLPENWQFIAHINPFFYMIDGFRYGLTGHHDGNLMVGMMVTAGVNIGLAGLCWGMIAKGYKLKS